MLKAIIFDFDGTLANTLPVCDAAFQKVFKTFDQRDLTSAEIRAMFGPSETGIIRQNLKHRDQEKAIDLYYSTYMEHHADLVKESGEISSLLLHLKNQGLKIGIVTGKARRSLDISLQALRMEALFDAIITGDDVDKPKPHPEGLHKALHLLNAASDEAVFIGDSDADIEAGQKANVYTIGVHWLPDFQTAMFSIEPDAVLKSVAEFLGLLERGASFER
ncbi:HAD family hydrolase [Planomicrobium sp. CPCC 101079]|uniref:HAD family hydrolase n=1 Tax=Planomicrobium sp. CPCC 101079 TaxID=2599618 RepID=UPI0011B3EB27|nr:HAD family hydrolase [Planomicrobium sp. CPCC 101079]TWT09367.1 HAD family hydrolase [Planomicrobium sp. CPCC 101079]